jgi:hypothetical protein
LNEDYSPSFEVFIKGNYMLWLFLFESIINDEGLAMEHLYLQILKFGKESNGKNISSHEIISLFRNSGYFTSVEEEMIDMGALRSNDRATKAFQIKMEHVYILVTELFHPTAIDPQGLQWVFKTESYFKLLEFEELEFARLNAQSAKKQSNWAIAIACLSMIISLVFGIYENVCPNNLNSDELKQIIQHLLQSDSCTFQFQQGLKGY